jgi:Cof subfamily protein (haloacid dehalogenase superfamily)
MTGRALPTRIAAVVSDVDGTLVRHDKTLTPRTIETVAKLRRAGIPFAIVSSRPPRGLTMLIARLDVTTFVVGFNGGVIARPDLSIVASHLIAPEVARHAIAAIEAVGAHAWVFSGQDWLIRDPNGPRVGLEQRTVGFGPTIVDDSIPVADAAAKIVAVSDDSAVLTRLQNELLGTLGDRATIVRSQAYYLDITHPLANKGDALWELARLMNIAPSQVAVIGDGENDIALFAQAGLSIAMGNAAAGVAEAADFTTGANDRDGAAAAIDWFVLRGNRAAMPHAGRDVA